MDSLEKKIKELHTKGLTKFENFLNEEEINSLMRINLKKKENIKNKSKDYVEWDDPDLWELICNKKIKSILDKVFESNYFYMHDSTVMEACVGSSWSWHRDNPCRRTGEGPDWDTDENYNVFTIIIYLSDSKESNSSLAFIPKSHNITYKRTLSNILRIIHHKIKKKQKFSFLRKIIERIISKEVNYKVGDICVFYCNLYHSGLSKINTSTKRLAAVIRYGGEGKHAKNFINYELNYRQGKNKYLVCKNKTKFFEFLKKNNLFISPEIPKKNIDGVFTPKNENKDSAIYGIYDE